ncbi:31446_t:CDS:2, partial [Racocetra persica]
LNIEQGLELAHNQLNNKILALIIKIKNLASFSYEFYHSSNLEILDLKSDINLKKSWNLMIFMLEYIQALKPTLDLLVANNQIVNNFSFNKAEWVAINVTLKLFEQTTMYFYESYPTLDDICSINIAKTLGIIDQSFIFLAILDSQIKHLVFSAYLIQNVYEQIKTMFNAINTTILSTNRLSFAVNNIKQETALNNEFSSSITLLLSELNQYLILPEDKKIDPFL